MRTTVFVATALVGALLGFAADTTSSPPAAKKKAAGKASTKAATKSHSTASHSTGHTTARKAVAKKGKKGPAHPVVPARSRQAAPTPDRYKEIQQALSSKGYLPAEQANGQWSDESASALKRFQADQKLDATGKINSLSLIALGLGPKHETAKPVGAAPATPPTPPMPQ
jgi:hypothetical protein